MLHKPLLDNLWSPTSSVASAREEPTPPTPPSPLFEDNPAHLITSHGIPIPGTPRLVPARPVGPDPANADEAVDMTLGLQELIRGADEDQAEENTRREIDRQAAGCPIGKDGEPVQPPDDADFDKRIAYFSAISKLADEEDKKQKEMEARKKREAKANTKNSEDGGKSAPAEVQKDVDTHVVVRRRKVKPQAIKPPAKAETDVEEDMSDDPFIRDYAKDHGFAQWNADVQFNEPAFTALPSRTHDEVKIRKGLRRWNRIECEAKRVLPDGSGIGRLAFSALKSNVKPDVEQLQQDTEEEGGWLATGPRGSKVRLTEEGQREGAKLMAMDDSRKAREDLEKQARAESAYLTQSHRLELSAPDIDTLTKTNSIPFGGQAVDESITATSQALELDRRRLQQVSATTPPRQVSTKPTAEEKALSQTPRA